MYDYKTMHLICECTTDINDLYTEVIQEDTAHSPSGAPIDIITAKVVLQSFNVKNWNQRIYPDFVIMNALNGDKMIQNDIKQGQWIGEFGHPLDLTPRRQMTFDPKTSSHRILNYWQEGNLLKGTIRTLPYGYGFAMAANAKDGVPLSFSLRALGGVDMVTKRVNPEIKIITYDNVYRPSHIESYSLDIINEAAGNIYIPTSSKSDEIALNESTVFEPLKEPITREQMEDYIKDKSENLKIAADLFNTDPFNSTLNESGYMILKTDGITAKVPVEEVINYQLYNNLIKNKQKRK